MPDSVRGHSRRMARLKASFMATTALVCFGGAIEAGAEPAASEPAAAEQPPQPSPQDAEQKSDVPLPTVSVETTRPRARSQAQVAPAPQQAPPPPPAQPVAAAGQGATPYQVTNTGITRLPVPLIDTPQIVNVIPQQIIQEQSVSTVEDALRYIPGITFSAGEGGQQGDGPIIRGFVARGDIFRDGIRDPGWYVRDAFSIDRIEVYKGPSAFAFGRGSTGGPSISSPNCRPAHATSNRPRRSRTGRASARWSKRAARKTTSPAASKGCGRT